MGTSECIVSNFEDFFVHQKELIQIEVPSYLFISIKICIIFLFMVCMFHLPSPDDREYAGDYL